MLAASSAFSQGLQGIVVEKYYQANAADVADATSNSGSPVALTTSSITYRVYVDMAAGYKFNSIFGNASHNLTVSSTTGFFNDASWGVAVNPGTVSTTNIRKNTGMIDSWFTTGGVAVGKAGVLKSEDTDGTIGNAQGILTNNPGGCFGLPIMGASGQDGYLPSSGTTYVAPNALGVPQSVTDILSGASNGTSIVLTNGSIAALGGVQGATSSNMVLIGQFTTNGQFSFALNIQIQNIATGVAENYVSSNPTGAELTHPSLTLVPNVAPTITLASSPSSSSIINGTAMTFTATAADANGTVTGVSFYLDGSLLSTDNTSPYTASYTAVAGPHSVYAVVTDNDCVSTTSSTLSFTSAANQAPTVTLTAPSSSIAGTVLTLSASAADVDGTVAQVEFFVNNVSVGVDNTAPYSVSYTAVLGSGQVVKAIATDDLGLTGISNLVTLNVLANVPPTVALSSPTSADAYVAPDAIVISANASDSDGSISQVEFFINNVSVGVDNSAPYSVTWTSTPGVKSFVAKATDSNGAITTSAAVSLEVADPNALPYTIGSLTQTCDLGTYCMPLAVSATNSIDNVKGFDVVLNYDATRMQPTGNITVYDVLTSSSYVETAYSIPTAGTINIAVYFNGSAPASAEFNGTGNVFCVEFDRLPGFAPVDSADVSVSFLQESYITGVQSKSCSAGKAYSQRNEQYAASLEFWSDNSPIVYDIASPNSYLITNINGVSNSVVSATAVQPNTSGVFTHDLTTGQDIQISRDVNNINSVQLIINAADAVLGKTLLINGAFTPTIYQILALDVNLDGVISAGDISQLKQRATLAIGEFQQAWNYDNTGVSNGQPSKDWVFVDQSRINSNPNYVISTTFPLNDGVGYSKYHVPVVPFALAANVTDYSNCPIVNVEVYKGIMLGDVNGSYATYTADGILKTQSSDFVLVDLKKAVVEGNKVTVPVSFHSTDVVNAFDLALSLKNDVAYTALSNEQELTESETYFKESDKTVRYSAFNMMNFNASSSVVYVTFETSNGILTEKDFASTLGLLNGTQTRVIFESEAADLTMGNLEIFPNPTSGVFTAMTNVDGRVDVIDVTGQLVHEGVIAKANSVVELELNNVSSGIYFVRLITNDAVVTKRLVLNK